MVTVKPVPPAVSVLAPVKFVQEGDATFFRILRAWAAEHHDGHGTTKQFVRLAQRKSGKDLNHLFTTWLYSPGKPNQA